MAYYLASAHSSEGAYLRWFTGSASSPLNDYVRLSGMPAKTTIGPVQLSIVRRLNANTPSSIFSKSEAATGQTDIFPTPKGAIEDSFFESKVVSEDTVKIVLKDNSSFSSLVVSPTEPSFFQGVI